MSGAENSSLLARLGANGYNSISPNIQNINIEPEDDAVSLAVKTLARRLTLVISLWLVSYVFVMVQVIDKGHFVKWTAFLFIPMWLGSLVGVISLVLIMNKVCCCKLKLVSKDEKFFLRQQGKDVTENYIDYESLPLLRRLFFWSCVSAIFILLCSITQVLFYLWLVESIIGMWHALIPVVTLVLLTLIYMLIVKTVSLLDCTVVFCIALELALFATKCRNDHELPWDIILIPLWLAQLLWAYQLGDISIKSYWGRYQLNERQLVCLIGYISALLSTVWAEVITLIAENSSHLNSTTTSSNQYDMSEEDDNEQVFSTSVLPQVLWLLSVVIFVCCSLLIMNMEAFHYADIRGHAIPLPLSKTASGWGPVDDGTKHFLLLGTVRINAVRPATSRSPSRKMASTGSGSGSNKSLTILPLSLPLPLSQGTAGTGVSAGAGADTQMKSENMNMKSDIEFRELQKRFSGELEGGGEDF
eukprot:gene5833-11776_t